MTHSRASVLFSLVTTDSQHTSKLWVPHPAPRPLVQCSCSGILLGHHSLWIMPYFLSRSSTDCLNFKCPECSTHCSPKSNICASCHIAGRLSHFPRMYLFSQKCLPIVRKIVCAKLLKKQLGKTLLGSEDPESKGGGRRGRQWTFLESQLCVRHWTKYLPNFLKAFPAGIWSRHIIPIFQMRKQPQKG